MDVNLVTLHVTVLDPSGAPVPDLTADDFEIRENGEPVAITFFEAVSLEATKSTTVGAGEDRRVVQRPGARDGVALVFDNASLQARNRRRVVAALEGVFGTADGLPLEVMVAAVSDGLRIVHPFTTRRAGVRDALATIESLPTGGEATKSRRRMLLGEMLRSSVSTGRGRQSLLGPSTEMVARLKEEIAAYRDGEVIRMSQTLDLLALAVQSLSGRPGRTFLVWVTEDMSLRPGLEVYRRYWRRFQVLDPTLTPPGLWGSERNLMRQFDAVLARAQASGVTIHVVDASDRDREVEDFDFDFSAFRDVIDGGQHLGLASGGGYYGGSRDFAPFVDQLEAVAGCYYVVGYGRPPRQDGSVRSVEVTTTRGDLLVRHPEHVFDRTSRQRLEDVAMAVTRLATVVDSPPTTYLRARAARPEDNGTVSIPVSFQVPVSGLLAGPEGVATVTVAVALRYADGSLSAPAVFDLTVDADSVTAGDALANAELELIGRPGVTSVGGAFRDEGSGAIASFLVDVPAPSVPTTGSP